MTQKPRKGDFRELKSKKFRRGTCHRTPLEACSFGACLRKLANIYLRTAPECCILLFVYLPNEFLDRCYKEKKTHEFNETANSTLPIRITVAHYFEEILFLCSKLSEKTVQACCYFMMSSIRT